MRPLGVIEQGIQKFLSMGNFETPNHTGQVVQSVLAMVKGFGYALLGAALLTGSLRILLMLTKCSGTD